MNDKISTFDSLNDEAKARMRTVIDKAATEIIDGLLSYMIVYKNKDDTVSCAMAVPQADLEDMANGILNCFGRAMEASTSVKAPDEHARMVSSALTLLCAAIRSAPNEDAKETAKNAISYGVKHILAM